MTLPSPQDRTVRWKDYQIDTPTFRLTPVEKPDMSPFLFHMTGRQQIRAIITAEGVNIASNYGFLRASVPESSLKEGGYDAKVVCLTESPTFALDFFRYRSYPRWSADQRFGIGFDKSELVKLGARPCIYADNQLKNDIIVLKKYIEKTELKDEEVKDRLKSLISSIYPLTTPILENEPYQGYMWEREWRYSNDDTDGFMFPYTSIRLICCPQAEDAEIRKILGAAAENIRFVRTWTEYDEVTAYMRQRSQEMYVPTDIQAKDDEDLLELLKDQISKHLVTLHSIEQYSAFIDSLGVKSDSSAKAANELHQSIKQMELKIKKIEAKIKNL